MKVFMYYPKDEQDKIALKKKIAQVHSEAVVAYLQKLSCPKEQKLTIINAIQDNIK